MTSTGSPGIRCISRKTRIETPISTGTACKRRLETYKSMPHHPRTLRAAAGGDAPLAGEPRSLCLLREVQVVEVGVGLEGEGQAVQLGVQGHHRALRVYRHDGG